MRLGFIGAGKMGFTLGKYLSAGGAELSGYSSRAQASAEEAAVFTGSRAFQDPASLIQATDLIFLTVPDDALVPVWGTLRDLDIKGKILCHTSGSQTSRIFHGMEGTGAQGASLHPLMALPDKLLSYSLLGEAIFTLEGGEGAVSAIRGLMFPFGNLVLPIDPSVKTLYHAAAAIVSNLSVALAQTGADIFTACGLSDGAPGLFSLMLANAGSIKRLGSVDALTGPVERMDTGTVGEHLRVLAGEDKELYRMLSKRLIRIARLKHPDRDYGPMLELLSGKDRVAKSS
jgi:predicted short-subunit dehydrogenase-like oxidoreductase (DUF2520 family)